MTAKGQKKIGHIAVYEHSPGHAGQSPIVALSYTIGWGGVCHNTFVGDSFLLRVHLEYAVYVFGCIVATKENNGYSKPLVHSGPVFNENGEHVRLVLEQINGDPARKVVNKCDKIVISSITEWKLATHISVDAEKGALSAGIGGLGKR